MKNRPIRSVKYTVSEPLDLVNTIHEMVTEVMVKVMGENAPNDAIVPLRVFLAVQRQPQSRLDMMRDLAEEE